VLTAVAPKGEGLEALLEALDAHWVHLEEHGLLEADRLERARFEVESVIQEWGRRRTREGLELIGRVAAGQLTPEEAAQQLLGLPAGRLEGVSD
jgi:LAO/AO transport system kinase